MFPLRFPPRFAKAQQWAVLEACAIGLVSGASAFLLKLGATGVQDLRDRPGLPLGLQLLLPPILGAIAGWLVQRFAPEAEGSGISQVQAALSGSRIALNLRVAIVKIASTMLVLGSGLPLGRQGPTVQVGASLAGQMSQWFPTSPDYRRQLIASGAAAGLAAGFNAPLAGVMLVLEQLLHDVSSFTLGTAVLAAFIGAVVSGILGSQSLSFSSEIVAAPAALTVPELPVVLLLGLLAGGLGILFNRGLVFSQRCYERLPVKGLPWRVAIASGISALLLLALPVAMRQGLSNPFTVTIPDSSTIALVMLTINFGLTLVAAGSGASGGIFAPALVLGSSLGLGVVLSIQAIFLQIGIPLRIDAPATYALAGMGAMFSAVTQGPITAIVIVFEMTRDFNAVLPLMVASITAYGIASLGRSPSQTPAPESLPTLNSSLGLTAAQVMASPVETLEANQLLTEVIQHFNRTHHRGFPVTQQGVLVGIVTSSDLDEHTLKGQDDTVRLQDVMTPHPLTVTPQDSLAHVLYVLNRYQISRVPVVDGRKLVGIITRADIIRAESELLSGQDIAAAPIAPSYVAYETRSPATGQGRLLVLLANPRTAQALLQFAAGLASLRNYELECLHLIPVSREADPSETAVSTLGARRMLQQAERLGRRWHIPVHTQIRVCHDLSAAILETISDRHINELVMGWGGGASLAQRLFREGVDQILQQAPCRVVLIKPGSTFLAAAPLVQGDHPTLPLRHWLIPLSAQVPQTGLAESLEQLLQLIPDPDLSLCQIDLPRQTVSAKRLHQLQRRLESRLRQPIQADLICARSVTSALLDLMRSRGIEAVMLSLTLEQLPTTTLWKELLAQAPQTVIVQRR
ncbi:chloride channel protein [Synechococcus elongatus]|uniref:Chloride channel protein n=1 Tax=Synechococcus elongatus PCC 11801 TaxID=2219813 RepID=A0AAN1QNW4_SYNEL|nr:chloride channel protein [Synechococcus elongatus]AZB72780.1 chloride channel protein [Synechococcus elongatus PCC 11801]